MHDAAALLPLAESVADGSVVDWEAAEAGANESDQAVIRQLRVLATLAALHRSLPTNPMELPSATVRRRTSTAPAIGSWGHLSLLERLGGGTFGEVYRAWDRHLEREVALKLLRLDEPTSDPQTSRVVTEGRLLARVRHSNVITVHGVGVNDGRVGLWMELIRGGTLEQRLLEDGPFSAREAALVGIDLCRALAAIHAAGLIHRDVKTQNVMRENGGRVVLMDLGTGREIDPSRRYAWPDLAGTPLYLAPEIFEGAPASERTDLYSLGVLLYHLVTGSFPVRATTIDELQEAHAKDRAVRLRDARADLPTSFVRVVDRAIAEDPEERYASAGALEAELLAALDEKTATTADAVGQERGRPRLTWAVASVLVATLAAIIALAAMKRPAQRGQHAAGAVPGSIRSIAVLPLANLSGDPSQEYFADGMTDELIGTLGRLGGVNVISRTSVMRFKGSNTPLPEIAKALNVDAILEGSVLVVEPQEQSSRSKRVRINARMIYAGSDTQIWDRKFESVVDDLLALQSQVASAVADGIHSRLASASVRRGQDFTSFDLYLKGRYYWNMRSEEGFTRGIEYFHAAIDRDSGYAPAYAGLADAYNLLGVYGFMPRLEATSRAQAAALQALSLDDALAEAHASLGYILKGRLEWESAEVAFKRAVALKPAYAPAHHWYAMYLLQRGRIQEALAEVSRALELDPLSPSVNGQFGMILVFARRYDEAIAQLVKAVQLDPTFARNHAVLAQAYALRGLYARALGEVDAAAAAGGDSGLRAETGWIYAMSGRRREALQVVDDLVKRYQQGESGAAGGLAVLYAALGDATRAFEWLDRARGLLDPVLEDLKLDPAFDGLRTDPRFGKLLASVGLAQ